MASLTLDWIQLAALVGALQGLLLSGALVAQRNNRTANRLLAALMVAFTIYLASGVYYATGLFRTFPYFFGFSYLMPWVFGPLVYLYAVAASDRSWRFRTRERLHFAMPLLIAVLSLPIYLSSGAEKVAMFDQWVNTGPPLRFAVLDPTKYVSGIGYSIATVLYLRRHRRRVEDSYSNIARVNLAWLLRLTAAAFGIWILATTLRVSDMGRQLRDEHISLAIAILIYSIGYMGLRQPEVFRYETSEYPVQKRPDAAPVAAPPPPEPEAETERYERSGLSDIEAGQLEASLLAAMDKHQPWKNSELTLADLAEQLNTTPHKLSEVLNAQIGQTFYDFVNGYRVREVQRRIKAGEARALKILALALDAGFSSKSTFNQAFKKHTSQTPSDFRAAVGA
jgi:AraC-like DNA-binding protein